MFYPCQEGVLAGVHFKKMLLAKSVITLSTGLSRASRPTSQRGLVELSGYAKSSASADGKTLLALKYDFANSIPKAGDWRGIPNTSSVSHRYSVLFQARVNRRPGCPAPPAAS
jgi:hypothetical protein